MYFYIYLCTNSYVFMEVWCRKLQGKETAMKFWRRLKLSFHLEALGTMGIESWCLLLVFCFWYFVTFCAWFAIFIVSRAWSCHFVCDVVLLFIFMVFFLFYFVLTFYVLRVLELVEKRGKVVKLGESWMKSNRQCKRLRWSCCMYKGSWRQEYDSRLDWLGPLV